MIREKQKRDEEYQIQRKARYNKYILKRHSQEYQSQQEQIENRKIEMT